jgi:hypothetical protein
MKIKATTEQSVTIETRKNNGATVQFKIYQRADGAILVTCTDGITVTPKTETGIMMRAS